MGDRAECEWGEFLMANYIATDTDLEAVADAIRTKGGTSADLVFPQGFVDAISAISGGGNPGEEFEWAGSAEIVTVGANTATSTTACANYFSSYNYTLLILLSTPTKNDQYLAKAKSNLGNASFRYRNQNFAPTSEGTNYSAYLVEGTQYLLLNW